MLNKIPKVILNALYLILSFRLFFLVVNIMKNFIYEQHYPEQLG